MFLFTVYLLAEWLSQEARHPSYEAPLPRLAQQEPFGSGADVLIPVSATPTPGT